MNFIAFWVSFLILPPTVDSPEIYFQKCIQAEYFPASAIFFSEQLILEAVAKTRPNMQ